MPFKNKEKAREYKIRYNKENKEKISKQRKEFRKNNKERLNKEDMERYYRDNRNSEASHINWRKSHREEISKHMKEYYQKNKVTRKEYNRKNLIKQYGITLEEYDKILLEQGNKCKICGKSKEDSKVSLCVDHNHVTGKIRGLLCISCNTALGGFKDNINILRKAIEYLERTKVE